MANGEVVFAAPWEGRVFALARTLSEQGHYTWDEFRACLIQELDQVTLDTQNFHYFDYFLNALQQLTLTKGLLSAAELAQLVQTFRERPHGHDH